MAEGYYQLTYRDLAERLGISPDAARMKANRKARAGLWRLLPDQVPGQERRVEIPAADLDAIAPKAAPAERSAAVATAERPVAAAPFTAPEQPVPAERGERSVPAEPVAAPEPAPVLAVETAEHSVPAERVETGERAVPAERPVPAEPAEAPSDVRSGEDVTGRGGIVDVDQSADMDLSSLTARVATLTDRLLAETSARDEARAELAAGEIRERELKVEIERLCARISALNAELERARRPWWRGLIQGGRSDD